MDNNINNAVLRFPWQCDLKSDFIDRICPPSQLHIANFSPFILNLLLSPKSLQHSQIGDIVHFEDTVVTKVLSDYKSESTSVRVFAV